MTVEHSINLAIHLAWPFVALIALFVLRPYVSQLTRAAGDLRDLLNRSGEMTDLVSQLSALSEATSDLKASQELDRAARPPQPHAAKAADLDALWKDIEREWGETKTTFRTIAQAAGVAVNFAGIIGVREATKSLTEKGIISAQTAAAMVDLSSQYQYMFRTTTDKAEFLNESVVTSYKRTATKTREALKAGQ